MKAERLKQIGIQQGLHVVRKFLKLLQVCSYNECNVVELTEWIPF
jgi:hypothetical protein